MLRKFLLSTALVAVAATAAGAADLPAPSGPYYKAPPVPVAVFDWTGFYIGVNVGYGWAHGDLTSFGVTGSEDLNGVLGGGQLGYNWQVNNNWVFGLEVDGQGTGQEANFAATAGAVTVTENDKLPWFITARGRIGYVIAPMWMVYATGGAAVADFKSTIGVTGLGTATWEVTRAGWTAGAGFKSTIGVTGFGTATWEITRAGWTAGAGIEAAINRNLSWKIEYLHLDTGTFNTNVFGVLPASVRLQDDLVRGGLNWRF